MDRNSNEDHHRSPDSGGIVAYSLIGVLGLLELAPVLAAFN